MLIFPKYFCYKNWLCFSPKYFVNNYCPFSDISSGERMYMRGRSQLPFEHRQDRQDQQQQQGQDYFERPPSNFGKAKYNGVLRSITELKSAEPYSTNHLGNKDVKDRRLELLATEDDKSTKFRYGEVFKKAKLEAKGHEVALATNTRSRLVVASHMCAILNSGKNGILLIGIHAQVDSDAHVIEGHNLMNYRLPVAPAPYIGIWGVGGGHKQGVPEIIVHYW
jgi:hypothetical protein